MMLFFISGDKREKNVMRKLLAFLTLVILISSLNTYVYANSDSCVFSVENSTVYAGETVVLKINVKSQGVASIKLQIDYPEELVLEDVKVNTELGGMFQLSPELNIINWISLNDVSGDFVLAEMTFKAPSNAENGRYDIKISCNPCDIFNENEEEVSYIIENGVINVTSKQIGDIDGNGVIDSTDYLRVKGYFLGTYVLEEASFIIGDVTKDGVINSTDYLRIKGHFLGTYDLNG